MASWQSPCSSPPLAPTTTPLRPEPVRGAALLAPLLLLLAAAACGRAEPPAPPAAAAPAAQSLDTPAAGDAGPRCAPSPEGSLVARLQGDVDARIDWSAPAQPQCLGGARPAGGGLRLVYRGPAGSDEPLLMVIGAGVDWSRGDRQANVPANLTLVREGMGAFYATQGDDKCAFDTLQREPLSGEPGRYRVSGRGYCTQPARALGDAGGVVLLSRFDVTAIVQDEALR
jgi:hypothetical protein